MYCFIISPERIITKAGPAYTFGYKSDDPYKWINLSKHIHLSYSTERRGSNASAGTYDINEEPASQEVNGTNGNRDSFYAQ